MKLLTPAAVSPHQSKWQDVMIQNSGSGRITRSGSARDSPVPHTYGGFGGRHANKSNKAIIGIAILIELRSSHAVQISLASTAIIRHAVSSIP